MVCPRALVVVVLVFFVCDLFCCLPTTSLMLFVSVLCLCLCLSVWHVFALLLVFVGGMRYTSFMSLDPALLLCLLLLIVGIDLRIHSFLFVSFSLGELCTVQRFLPAPNA